MPGTARRGFHPVEARGFDITRPIRRSFVGTRIQARAQARFKPLIRSGLRVSRSGDAVTKEGLEG